MSTPRPETYRVDLVALPDRTPGVVRLRAFLKAALRQYRLRATRVAETTAPPASPPPASPGGPDDETG
jgi:hypothetical protein